MSNTPDIDALNALRKRLEAKSPLTARAPRREPSGREAAKRRAAAAYGIPYEEMERKIAEQVALRETEHQKHVQHGPADSVACADSAEMAAILLKTDAENVEPLPQTNRCWRRKGANG